MMCHYTKFGYKRFSIWGDIVQMNIRWNSESFLWPSPWPQQCNPVFSQDNPAYYDVPSNQVLFRKDRQIRRHIRKSYFDYMILHCDLDLEHSKAIFLKDTLAHDDASPYQIWWLKVQRLRLYHLDKHSLTLQSFAATLTLNIWITFLHKTLWLIKRASKPSLVPKGSKVQKI